MAEGRTYKAEKEADRSLVAGYIRCRYLHFGEGTCKCIIASVYQNTNNEEAHQFTSDYIVSHKSPNGIY